MRYKVIPLSHILALVLLLASQVLALGTLSFNPSKLLFRRNVIYMPFPIPLGILYTLFLIPSILFLLVYIVLEFGGLEYDDGSKVLRIKKLFRRYEIPLSQITFIGRARRRWVVWYMYAYYLYFLYYTWYWLVGSSGFEVFNRSYKSDLLGIYLNLGWSLLGIGILSTAALLVLIIRPRFALIYNGVEIRFDLVQRNTFLEKIKSDLGLNEVKKKEESFPKIPLLFASFFILLFLSGLAGAPFGDFEIGIPFIALVLATHEFASYFQNYTGSVGYSGSYVIRRDRIWKINGSRVELMPRKMHILTYIAVFFIILETVFTAFPLIQFPGYYTSGFVTVPLMILTLFMVLWYIVWPFNYVGNELISAIDLKYDEFLNYLFESRENFKPKSYIKPRLQFFAISLLIAVSWLILALAGVLPPLQTVF